MTLLQVLEHEWLPIRSGGGQSRNVHQAALLEQRVRLSGAGQL